MLSEKKSKTIVGIAVGMFLKVVGLILIKVPAIAIIYPLEMVGFITFLIGWGIFIWGCINYAEGKGQSRLFGYLGLFGFVGLFILLLAEDKNKTTLT